MKESNRVFLDNNRGHYITLTRAGFIQNLTNETRQQLLDLIREEFNPGYLCCLHCSADIAAMITYAYTQYDLKLEQDGQNKLRSEDIDGSRPARKATNKSKAKG
jgi:hypothetical protein